jgi:aminopeptidase-like protein
MGEEINARLWVLNLSDRENSLLEIAERSRLPFAAISEAAELLCRNGLLSAIPDDDQNTQARDDRIFPRS